MLFCHERIASILPRWAPLHLTRVHPRLLARLLAWLQVGVVTPVAHARAALSGHVTPLPRGPSCWLMPLATSGVYVGPRVTVVTIPKKQIVRTKLYFVR